MILLLNGSERNEYSYLFNVMYQIRADVFYDRLRWDVQIENGLERDYFDDQNPLYLISVDEHSNQVRGSVRLLPTTGPNMLRDVFPSLLPIGEKVESATIWECSRFSIRQGKETRSEGKFVSDITGELLAAVVEVGLIAGLTEVLGVFDARMIRVFRSAGYPPLVIGKPHRIGSFMTYAGLFDISEEALEGIHRATGINRSVLEPKSVARCLAA